jgi:uncharacterized membrane protein YphA (DoxX/SURF4 family)
MFNQPVPGGGGRLRTRLLRAVAVSRTYADTDRDIDRRPGDWVRPAGATPITTKLYWILRIGVAFEFIGHGMAGFSKSKAWLPYFELFGFSPEFAHDYLYYVTGTVDVTIGFVILVWPARILLLYMSVWGAFTAFLRPASGESWYELWERGGNYAMPLALLLLVGWGGRSVRRWVEYAKAPRTIDTKLATVLEWVMRAGIALLLIGHGGFGLQVRKQEWYDYFGVFGVSPAAVDSAHLMTVFGVFEILLGLAVLIRPWRGLLLFVLVWKLGTELLRPVVGQELFQFIERSGDYALPIAVFMLVGWRTAARRETTRTPAPDATLPSTVSVASR